MRGRAILIGLAVCWLLAMLCVPMTFDTQAAQPWGAGASAADAVVAAPAGEKVEGIAKFNRDMRKLGVNRRSVKKAFDEIKAEGVVDMSDQEAVADAIEAQFMTRAMADPGFDWQSIDWDKVFEFIMKIIALFMSIS